MGSETLRANSGTGPRSESCAVIERYLGVAAEASGASAAILRHLIAERDGLHVLATSALPDEQAMKLGALHGDCGVCWTALGDGRAHISRRSCHCSRALGRESSQLVVAIPLVARGTTLGVLTLLFAPPAHQRWNGQNLPEWLRSLADMLAIAVDSVLNGEADFSAGLLLQRHAIANDLHDSLAQSLTYLRMRTTLLRDAITRGESTRALGYLSDVDASLVEAQARVRSIISDYRSDAEALQLRPAVEQAVAQLRASGGKPIELRWEARDPGLSEADQVQVLYIVREAITNALKHAHASRIAVQVRDWAAGVELAIEDDGVGIGPAIAGVAGHFGLQIMRERAARVGADLLVEPKSGGGTTVRLRLAVPRVGRGLCA